MTIGRRHFLLASSAMLGFAGTLRAQQGFPDKPIRIIAPFAPGSSDVIARRLGEHVAKALGQSVVVESRPGAQGIVASRAVARARNDGYTLLLGTNSTHAASPYLFKDPGYDPVKDFTPITRFTVNPLVLAVSADAPIHSVADFIRYARARSGKLSYGAGNTGGLVASQMLKTQAGFQAEAINYAGNSQAVNDFVAGRLDFMVTDPMIVKPFVESGKLRMLGLTSRQRLPSLPDLVPLSEQALPDYDYASWIGLFGPAGLPADVERLLHDAFADALKQPDNARYIASIGMIASGTSSQEFTVFVQDQIQLWGHLTKDAGLTPQ